MPIYRTCPHCGAHLDPGERCDCQQEKREDAPDAAGTPSQNGTINTSVILSSPAADVNPSLRLREIRQQTGTMAKDAAMVVRNVFPKFNRQLLAQCEAWEKYGVIIHPDGLKAICEAYNVTLAPVPAAKSAPVTPTRHISDKNQCERILRHFKDYGSITAIEAMQEYGIMRLASRISDLRRLGYAIRKTMETSRNSYGELTTYARYSLEDGNNGTDA